MKILTRLHTFAADHIRCIQYPNIRGPQLQFFRYPMAPSVRAAVAALSIVGIGICSCVLAFLAFVIYSVLS